MDLAKELKLNDKEKQQINYNDQINNQILWDISKDPNKKINLNSDMIKLLKDTISKLDKEKKITVNMIDIALKIQKL